MVNDQPASLNPRERRHSIIAATVVLLLLLVAFWPAFEKSGWPMDEGMVLVYPELVAHGQLPYRNFETFYGPANPYARAGAYSIFGTHIFTERGVGLFYRLVAIVAVFGIARRWGTLLASGCMFVAGTLLISTQLIASGWIAGIACLLVALWIFSSAAGVARFFLAGLWGGIALLFRPDLAPAVILSALPFLWRTSRRTRGQYAAGLGLGLLPLAIVTICAGLTNTWNNLFYYPVIVSNPGRRLPLLSAERHVLNLLIVHLVGSFAILAASLKEWRRGNASNKAGLLFSLGITALVLTPQATQRLDLNHLLFAGVISLPFLAAGIATLSEQRLTLKGATIVGLVATVAAIAIAAPQLAIVVRNAFASGLSAKQTSAVFVEHEGRSFPFGSQAAARDAAQLFEKLQAVSNPGERLFVGPGDLRRTNCSDTFIYHLFPRLKPASYFLEMNPLSANRPATRLASDVASADWLILNRRWDTWREPNRSVENGDEMANTVVVTQFEPVGEYGPFVLFHHKTAPQGPRKPL